jgi:hypothetical protein
LFIVRFPFGEMGQQMQKSDGNNNHSRNFVSINFPEQVFLVQKTHQEEFVLQAGEEIYRCCVHARGALMRGE